jgi:hypothetical protein
MLDLLQKLASSAPEAIVSLPVFETAHDWNQNGVIYPLNSLDWGCGSIALGSLESGSSKKLLSLNEPPSSVGHLLISWSTVVAAAMNIYASSLSRGSTSVNILWEPISRILLNVCNRVLELVSTKSVRTHGRDLGAVELLWMYRHRHASDERDHIYGLAGLLPGQFALAGLKPHYELSIAETYEKATVNLVRIQHHIRVLVGTWIKGPDKEYLSSWAQDWGYTWKNAPYHPLLQILLVSRKASASLRPRSGKECS